MMTVVSEEAARMHSCGVRLTHNNASLQVEAPPSSKVCANAQFLCCSSALGDKRASCGQQFRWFSVSSLGLVLCKK